MADLSQIKLPNNNTYNIKDALLSSYDTGANDTAGRWTVTVPRVTELYEGLTIRVYLNKSYNSTFNTINVNGLGEKLVKYRRDAQLTFHVPQYACITLTYHTNLAAYSISNAYCDPVNSANYRGAWTANTSYAIGDSVLQSSKYYICKKAHTSGASWATTNWNASTTPYTSLAVPTSATVSITDGWLLQTTYNDGNDVVTVRSQYPRLQAGGNGIKQYSLFSRIADGTYSSFTTNSGTGEKTFDTTNYFDPATIYYFNSSSNLASGSYTANNTVDFQHSLVDLRYTFNGIVADNTSAISGNLPVYIVFDKESELNGYYKLKSPYITQTPNDWRALYVLVAYAYDYYRCDLWVNNPIFTYDNTSQALISVTFGAVSQTANYPALNEGLPLLLGDDTHSIAGTYKSSQLVFSPEYNRLILRQNKTPSGTGPEPSFRIQTYDGNTRETNLSLGEWSEFNSMVTFNGDVEFGENSVISFYEGSYVWFQGELSLQDGSITGEGNIDIDGDITCTGALSADTLNGATIGNSPEFTDTQSDWNASSGKAQILNKPTLGTASAKDVPASGNASTTQVVMGNDTRLTDARTPSSHTHGNIQNGGTISSTAVTPASTDYLLISDTSNSGKIERGIAIGTDTTKYLRNDGTWEVPSGGSGGSVGQIYYCETDSTSTTTAFVVNATGVTALTDGLILCIKNTISASASGCTINVNNLGAKSIWLSEANSACTTQWKANTTYLFVFDYTNDRWVMQTGRDTDTIGYDIVARYSRLQTSGNGVKQYSVFALLPNGKVSSFTTTNGTGTKTFDTTNYFDIRNVFAYTGSSNKESGEWLGASAWKLQGYDVDMRYSFNGVTTKSSTSSLTTDGMVYLVFDPSAESGGCYKLKSPYYTQTPTSTGCIYVLLGVMRDAYRLDLWGYNPAFTYDGTKLVPFSNTTLSGLADTSISNPSAGDLITYDGNDWVNTNTIALKDTNGHTTVTASGSTGAITVQDGFYLKNEGGDTRAKFLVTTFDRGSIYLYDENDVNRLIMYGDGGVVIKKADGTTSIDLDGTNSKVVCTKMSTYQPTYTITKTSGTWNVASTNPITATRTGNVVHLQINLQGTGSNVNAGSDGFIGTLGGSALPCLPVKFVDYYGNNVLIMYIQPNGEVKVRLTGSNLAVTSGGLMTFSGTFVVND